MDTETITNEIYDSQGNLIRTDVMTRQLSQDEIDQDTIRDNIAAAKATLTAATSQLNAANTQVQAATTQAQSLSALKALSAAQLTYAQANNQAWLAMLPALKYIAARLVTEAGPAA